MAFEVRSADSVEPLRPPAKVEHQVLLRYEQLTLTDLISALRAAAADGKTVNIFVYWRGGLQTHLSGLKCDPVEQVASTLQVEQIEELSLSIEYADSSELVGRVRAGVQAFSSSSNQEGSAAQARIYQVRNLLQKTKAHLDTRVADAANRNTRLSWRLWVTGTAFAVVGVLESLVFDASGSPLWWTVSILSWLLYSSQIVFIFRAVRLLKRGVPKLAAVVLDYPVHTGQKTVKWVDVAQIVGAVAAVAALLIALLPLL